MGVMRNGKFCYDKYLFRGVPDILAFRYDRIIFVEAKAGKNIQSDDQLVF